MADARHDLGQASSVKAEALGQPGSRRFRLLVAAQAGSAVLWLEKDQLFNLGVSIKRLLYEVEMRRDQEQRTAVEPLPEPPRQHRTLEFTIGRLAVGYEPAHRLGALLAYDVEVGGDPEQPTLNVWAPLSRMSALADEAFAVCAAGRPLCPVCQAPLDTGQPHVCRRRNGYHASTP